MATTVLPPPELLPDVLPTDRLTAKARPVPPIREGLRHIPSARNALTVAMAWVQSLGVAAAAAAINKWWAYVIAFFLMGRGFALLAILGHEAAHRLLFKTKRWNDFAGKWLLAYPSFTAFDVYRRVHMAHHKDEMGPDEPDKGLYAGYPITKASFMRKMKRDAFGISGYKNMKPLFQALTKSSSRPLALRILASQLVVALIMTVGFGLAFGVWWLYPVLWLAPWMSVWKVINRLRSIAEHGGMARSDDRRMTTHVVRQHWIARFWMVPYNTGWHLAHHVDAGVPWRKLPELHRILVEDGWVTPGIEYKSYTQLWRTLASRPAESVLEERQAAA